MSRRNFILLIIVLVIMVAVVFSVFYYRKSPNTAVEGGINFIAQFNPFSSNTTTTQQTTTTPVNISGYQPASAQEMAAKLKEVSSVPIAGFVVFSGERLKASSTPAGDTSAATTANKSQKTEFATALRYVDRATGNIYETFADNIAEHKFSSTIIPMVYESLFGNKGQSVVMRYLNTDGATIETFLGNLPKEALLGDSPGNEDIKGSSLPENIKDASLSPDTVSLFYLFKSSNAVVGTILNLSTNKKTQVFDSPFTEWLSQWPNSKIITLTTKPASGIPGYMYILNTSTRGFSRTISNVNGLTTLTSPDGKLVLYGDDNLALNVYNISTGSSSLLSLRTLPEKCAWGGASDAIFCAVPTSIPTGQYPDNWYKGLVSFSDQFWKIDIKTGNTTLLADPSALEQAGEIDGTKLALDSGENYLFFINKKDSHLWELGLR